VLRKILLLFAAFDESVIYEQMK